MRERLFDLGNSIPPPPGRACHGIGSMPIGLPWPWQYAHMHVMSFAACPWGCYGLGRIEEKNEIEEWEGKSN